MSKKEWGIIVGLVVFTLLAAGSISYGVSWETPGTESRSEVERKLVTLMKQNKRFILDPDRRNFLEDMSNENWVQLSCPLCQKTLLEVNKALMESHGYDTNKPLVIHLVNEHQLKVSNIQTEDSFLYFFEGAP